MLNARSRVTELCGIFSPVRPSCVGCLMQSDRAV